MKAWWKRPRASRQRDYARYVQAKQRDRKMGMIFLPVTHPDYPDTPLTRVVSRPCAGRTPWYLLTNLPILTDDDA
jgi:hypothetical protein